MEQLDVDFELNSDLKSVQWDSELCRLDYFIEVQVFADKRRMRTNM